MCPTRGTAGPAVAVPALFSRAMVSQPHLSTLFWRSFGCWVCLINQPSGCCASARTQNHQRSPKHATPTPPSSHHLLFLLACVTPEFTSTFLYSMG